MDHPKLTRCDLNVCQAMCCYDGVYLEEGEEGKLTEIIKQYPTYFKHLPDEPFIDGEWQGVVSGRKTATNPYTYTNEHFPTHFQQTRCVFATDEHLCSLQVASEKESEHPWDFKPKSCWMFPLREEKNQVQSPLGNHDKDPCDLGEEYPGYAKYVSCGKHTPDGDKWETTLKDEIDYHAKKNNT